MARYKHFDRMQMRMIPVDFSEQILPGSFEDVLDRMVERHMNVSVLDNRYKNDLYGASAYDPRILVKIILYAYSRKILSSRAIEHACKTNVVFMALSGGATPDYTTIAIFVSSLGEDIIDLFTNVLSVCMRLGLVEGRTFAIDGCKLPSNASKEWSGTHRDLAKKRDRLKGKIKLIMEDHRKCDRRDQRTKKIKNQVKRIEKFLKENKPRQGKRGKEIQSNITDNESAKMKTSRGIIQGYTGVAMVDAKHQVIVTAGAHGTGQEFDLLRPTIEALNTQLKKRKEKLDLRKSLLLADSGYFSEENLEYLWKQQLTSLIPDPGFRKRNPQFKTAERYKDRIQGRSRQKARKKKYELKDFKYDSKNDRFICPNGKNLRLGSASTWVRNDNLRRYVANQSDCSVCHLRSKCLSGTNVKRRNLHVLNERNEETHSRRMMKKIDSKMGRKLYSKRMGIVEPVFANLTFQKGLNRFTLRTQKKVNVQWNLFSIINNIEKITNFAGKRKLRTL